MRGAASFSPCSSIVSANECVEASSLVSASFVSVQCIRSFQVTWLGSSFMHSCREDSQENRRFQVYIRSSGAILFGDDRAARRYGRRPFRFEFGTSRDDLNQSIRQMVEAAIVNISV